MSVNRRALIAASFAAAAAAALPAHAAEKSTAGTPMRRSDRALSKEECLEAIRRTPHAVLGTADAAGIPYAVPVTPVMLDGKLYFHCSRANGRRTQNLRMNPNVSLTFIAKQDTVEPEFAVNFVSVIVAGKVREITDAAEVKRIQLEICKRHAPSVAPEKALAYFEKSGGGIAIWEVTPSEITGKSRNKQLYFGAAK